MGGVKQNRSAGLDIVRCVAILFVIGSHFFLNTNAQATVFTGLWIVPQGMMRTLFLTNVPLFLILTGYLNLNKRVNRKYYRGMIAVILSYIFISVVTIFFRTYFMGEHLSAVKWFLKITDFSAIAYAWYIEMWIGLFLLTPFLNILWKNIATRKHKILLILTLYLLSALPDMFNRYGVHLAPGYWEFTYPCAFYFIGAFIREYHPTPKRSWLLLGIFGCCLINPLFNFLFVKHHTMIQIVGDSNGVIGIPLSAMVFLLLYRIGDRKENIDSPYDSTLCNNKTLVDYDGKTMACIKRNNGINRFFKGVLESVSRVSLDMYLASYMFDIAAYSYFKPYIANEPERAVLWWFVTVPIVFVESYIFAVVKSGLFKLLHLPTK